MKRILVLVTAVAMVIVSAGLSRSANELNGTYISQDNKNEYITFSPDGKFFLKQQKKPYNIEQPYATLEGTYNLNGDLVTLKLPNGGEAQGKIQGDVFIDNQRKPWVKQGSQPKLDSGINLRHKSNL